MCVCAQKCVEVCRYQKSQKVNEKFLSPIVGTPPFLKGGDGISPKTLKGVGSHISILKGWDAQKGGDHL